jgi:hypothetical protein
VSGAPGRVLLEAPTVRLVVEERDGCPVVRKTYRFPRVSQRWKGALRHTWLGRPKGEREAANLLRLAEGGAPVLRPLEWGSQRDALGFVLESWLVLPFLEGWVGLDRFLTLSPPPIAGWDSPEGLWREVGHAVSQIHDLGCLYRDLRPRNLLVGPGELAWIDASNSRFRSGPLGAEERAEDLLGFWLPVPPDQRQGFAAFWKGYGGDPVLGDLAGLERQLFAGGRRRLRRVVRRERERAERTL